MTETDKTEGRGTGPLPFFRLETIKKRADFKAAQAGRRFNTQCFTMQARPRPQDAAPGGTRFGFTVTKKIGTAVERNRIRRRLREAVRKAGPGLPGPACDYVIIARRGVLDLPFIALVEDVGRAVRALARPRTG